MIILYIICAAVICVVGYAIVWVATGVLMSIFSKKFQFQDETDEGKTSGNANALPDQHENL